MLIRKTSLALIVLICALHIFTVTAATTKPISVFSTFPQAKMKKSLIRHYDHFKIIVGRSEEQYDTKIVSGALLRQFFSLPNSYSEQNILNNYVQQIKSQNGQILFQCSDKKDCGNAKAIQRTIHPLNTLGDNHPHLVTAKFTKGGRVTYVSIFIYSCCDRNSLQIDELTETTEPLNLVKLDGNVLAEAPTALVFKDQSKKDDKNAHDHPLLSRLPGSYIRKYKTSGFEKNSLVIGRKDNKNYQHISIDGKTTAIGYVLPRAYSELEVIENYRAALSKANFVEKYSCQSKKCGKNNRFSREVHALEKNGNDQSQRYLIAKLSRPEGDIWVTVYVIGYANGLWLNLNIVESNQIINDRVAVNADAIKKAIELTGHIALDGILFKFDSDELQPESMSVISELANYIKSVPDYNFYVVGHTDDKGKMSYNAVLSEKRATKVSHLLINKYHIQGRQLISRGVGELAPKSSNASESGRQLNRRVELVLRSDLQ